MKPAIVTTCLLAALAAGCRHGSVAPMPGSLPSAGLLVRTDRIRLSRDIELRCYDLLDSTFSNDFYPFNVPHSRTAARLLSRLYVRRGLAWQPLDFASMPADDEVRAGALSPDGRRIIFLRPDVSAAEGEFPRAFGMDRRSHRVVLYDHQADREYVTEEFTDVSALGRAQLWRPDGQAVAFTTTVNRPDGPSGRELVMLDPCGNPLLCGRALAELAGLEFICFSPDGSRIAALRSIEAGCGGAKGGVLVEVDPAGPSAVEVGEIPASAACKYLDRFESLVAWDKDSHCSVKAE